VIRRVAVIGRTRLAVECLEVLLHSGDEVVAVIADPDDSGIDGWQPSLSHAASVRGLRVVQPANVNEPAVVAELAAMRPDFLFSFQASSILRGPLIGVASVAALNLHFGRLPRYRGVAPIAWALINGESESAVTLHHIERGVDSGPIVAARIVPINAEQTGRALYDACVDAGIGLFAEVWPTIRLLDEVPGTPQDESESLYYNRHALDFRARRVPWNLDCEAIANRMRAFIFPPFQHPELFASGQCYEVRAFTWDRQPHAGRPGEILEATEDAVVVAAPGGRILLHELQSGDRRLVGIALSAHFAPGSVFDSPD